MKNVFASIGLNIAMIVGIAMSFSFSARAQFSQSFKERLRLREVVTSLTADQTKRRMSEFRYAEDLDGEELAGFKQLGVDQKSGRAFGKSEEVQLNPIFSRLDFQSGDVIVLRGMSTISTTIATITEAPSQFSHSLILYIDSVTGKAYGIESLLDKGMVVRSLEDILTEGVPRMVLYRHSSADLAAQAGKIAYDAAMEYINKGETYPYDFKFDLLDYRSIYCAELIRMAYDLASSGEILLPTFPSVVGPKLKTTLSSLEIQSGSEGKILFAPGDLDLEKEFTLVAEWRDYRTTLNYRIKDQLLIKILEWIEMGALKVDYSEIMRMAKVYMNKNNPNNKNTASAFDAAKFSVYSNMVNNMINQMTEEVLKANELQRINSHKNFTSSEIQDYLEGMRSQMNLKGVAAQLFKFQKNTVVVNSAGSCSRVFN